MSINRNMTKLTIASVLALATSMAGLGTGCTAVPEEVQPQGPLNCNDLVVHSLHLSMLDGMPVNVGQTMAANEGFRISWFAKYERGYYMNHLGYTGDYVARVSIEQNGVELYAAEIDATPINVASGEYDEVHVETGLPPGNYLVRVALDIYGTVDQCNDLVYALNNVTEREFTVAADPVDDVASSPSGHAGDEAPLDGQTRGN